MCRLSPSPIPCNNPLVPARPTAEKLFSFDPETGTSWLSVVAGLPRPIRIASPCPKKFSDPCLKCLLPNICACGAISFSLYSMSYPNPVPIRPKYPRIPAVPSPSSGLRPIKLSTSVAFPKPCNRALVVLQLSHVSGAEIPRLIAVPSTPSTLFISLSFSPLPTPFSFPITVSLPWSRYPIPKSLFTLVGTATLSLPHTFSSAIPYTTDDPTALSFTSLLPSVSFALTVPSSNPGGGCCIPGGNPNILSFDISAIGPPNPSPRCLSFSIPILISSLPREPTSILFSPVFFNPSRSNCVVGISSLS
ncbi:hypothetical protein AX774_g3955 [Zancudomyces culisetae]|uniref:Uncharacterized protein n=1 Tax=Zancudomyces culisetae TaxID=1213189 RepID=A0A1R1PNL7_ZANCU|nr:hypothetical protein AX774_g3955 [Zancudomyces culisetae]|eukprot:OMH82567.1 hypothetical protein AX774_g3955 [Zancudomyces culisetae]